jgi:hypothetical protein
LILWPFGPVALVYDVVDLECGEIPVDVQAFVAMGAMTEKRIKTFIERMVARDILVSITDAGDGRAGSIQTEVFPKDEKTRGIYKLKVNGNHTPAVRFVTITHELAHLFLGHLGEDKKWGIKDRRFRTHTQRELEAETVAYLVAKRNGVESKSETYLANYVRDNPTVEDLDFYQIARASGQIETLLGIAAHTQFDPPNRQSVKHEIPNPKEFYFQVIPQDEIMGIVAMVRDWIQDGVDSPIKLAAKLLLHADGCLMGYSEAIWSACKMTGVEGPSVPDWVEVYRFVQNNPSSISLRSLAASRQ